jgi:LmbE family N-acetylglucosaminyl deacetylase
MVSKIINILRARLRPIYYLLRRLRGKAIVDIPVVINKPEGSTILVLSPHPDDDVIGCGGTLYKHHLAGDHITVAYITDGRKGSPKPTDEEILVHERRQEATAAANIIGIEKTVFLDNRDMELMRNDNTIKQMLQLIVDCDPDIIYLPSFFDNHQDHIATNKIFTSACGKIKKTYQCYAYEVWTPLIPNRLVDISDCIDVKIAAIRQHQSQVIHINFMDKISGLNAFRTITAPKLKYAEAFYYCHTNEYVKLCKARGLV